jgi:Tfp pilus assembly protein PilO
MTAQMTTREKTLAIVVGVMVVALLSYLLLTQFQKKLTMLRGQLRDKQVELDTMKTLISERDLWLARGEWLKSHQAPLSEDPSKAAGQLLEDAKQIGLKHSITLENVNYGNPVTKPNYQSISVAFETKSDWKDLVDFLFDVQSPTDFRVFESCNLSLEPDKKMVRGKFKLAKWYAPKAG